MSGRRLVLLFALLPAVAWASGIEGEGRIEVVGGWRLTPNGYFEKSAETAGQPVTGGSHGGPMADAAFGYGASDNIEVSIDLLAGHESLTLGDKTLSSLTYGALVGARFFALFAQGRLRPSIGLSVGPILIDESGSALAQMEEKLTQGYSLSLGLDYKLGDCWAVAASYRLLLARGMVPGIGGINGGGSWFGIGLAYYFAPEPDLAGGFH